jgi:PKD repeat protein
VKKPGTYILLLSALIISMTGCRKSYVTPEADFVAQSTTLYLNQYDRATLCLTDHSANDPTAWAWLLTGNGNTFTSADQNPTFILSDTGLYTIRLTVSNSRGSNTKTMANYIRVLNVRIGHNYIIAGDSSAAYYRLMDTTFRSWGEYYLIKSIYLDPDNNHINDLYLQSKFYLLMGGSELNYCSSIKVFDNCEILKSATESMPTPLDAGSVINSQGIWTGNTSLYFSYDFANGVNVFEGWNGLTGKYAGFRIIGSADTAYGWIQINISGYNQITVKDMAYRY